MRQTRVYLPLSRVGVRRLGEERSLEGSAHAGFTVTPQLERAYPGLDEEDLEYLALKDAAEAALALRATPGDRLVVVAADLEPAWVEAHHSGDDPLSQVRITESVPLGRIVSFHLDAQDAAPHGGGPLDLLWYDATELDEVVGMFR